MIGEVAFKGFCRGVADGIPMRALFITPSAILRDEQQLGMFNEASARGLLPIMRSSDRTVMIGDDGVAVLRIAHPYLDRELKGLQWHFIHGLEYLEKFKEAEEMKAHLQAMTRL